MCEVISLINLKGGVGKTVSSINIAYSFAEFNKKVLIVDADSQGNIATSLGMIADELDNTLCDLIDEAIADGVSEQRVVECIKTGFKQVVLPAKNMKACEKYKDKIELVPVQYVGQMIKALNLRSKGDTV